MAHPEQSPLAMSARRHGTEPRVHRRAGMGSPDRMKRLIAIVALVLAVLAFFSVHIWKITSLRELAIAVGLLAVTVLL